MKNFGIYIAISTANKNNCIPIQCDDKQTNMNDETKNVQNLRKASK
jgi:hypothetical protein